MFMFMFTKVRFCDPGKLVCFAWLASFAVFPSLLAAQQSQPATAPQGHTFQREAVLGADFELRVRGADEANAQACEKAVLAEIERLKKLLDINDPASEISRFRRAKGNFECSADLLLLLRACDDWRRKTKGLFNVNTGGLVDLWAKAAEGNQPPNRDTLTTAVRLASTDAWQINTAALTARPLTKLNLRISDIVRGYIIDKALMAGRVRTPDATGLLLNIGGTVAVYNAPGSPSWRVDVVDPSADSAAIKTLTLTNQAAATCLTYKRVFQIGQKNYSRIINPRTGQPAEAVVGATVAAPMATAATALAEALCIMSPTRGIITINRLGNVDCLIAAAKGKKIASLQWATIDPAWTGTAADLNRWPSGYYVKISLKLRKDPPGGRGKNYRPPYVVVWVEDNTGKPVKTLAMWGKNTKFYPRLSKWYRLGQAFVDQAKAVTGDRRSAGEYLLLWNGTDGFGKPVGQGTYRIRIDIARPIGRNHNTYVHMSQTIRCDKDPDAVAIAPNAESDGVTVTYTPRRK
jgi:thiamine biosynthesis lipoprotein ApbE